MMHARKIKMSLFPGAWLFFCYWAVSKLSLQHLTNTFPLVDIMWVMCSWPPHCCCVATPQRLDASTLLHWYCSTRSVQQAISSATRPDATGKVPSPPLSLSLFSVVNLQNCESVTKCMHAYHCVSNLICSVQCFFFLFFGGLFCFHEIDCL